MKKTFTMQIRWGLAASAFSAVLAFGTGCDSPDTTPLMLSVAPVADVSIQTMKSAAKVGDQVVVRGRIGGQARAFVEESQEFRMMDLSIPYCGQSDPEGACPQPWDYCCEKAEVKASAGVVAKIAAAKWKRERYGPLQPLMEVVVTGTVKETSPDWILEVQTVYVASDPNK